MSCTQSTERQQWLRNLEGLEGPLVEWRRLMAEQGRREEAECRASSQQCLWARSPAGLYGPQEPLLILKPMKPESLELSCSQALPVELLAHELLVELLARAFLLA